MKILASALISVCFIIASSESGRADGYNGNDSTEKGYKLMYKAENWTNAVDACAADGAKLAVPKSKDEFTILQQIVRGMKYFDITGAKYKYLVWLGISNLEDYRVWKNIDGENIELTGFHDWSGQNGQDPRPDPKEPHCVGMDASNPGLREFWCHLAQPYICEKKITI